MDDLLKNKFLWIVAVFTALNIGAFLMINVLPNKAADVVIERLEKNYSPSPYGPGFDPDKVDTVNKLYYELKQFHNEGEYFENSIENSVRDANEFQVNWERDRGNIR